LLQDFHAANRIAGLAGAIYIHGIKNEMAVELIIYFLFLLWYPNRKDVIS